VRKERLKSPRARLFIALDLPEDVRAGIVRWGESALGDPALRPVRPESLHITLAFLGHRPERQIERLSEIVADLSAPAPAFELSAPVARPSLRRARLFALPVRSPGAVALQGELEAALVAKRLCKPEKRTFWPHVTVARVKPAGRGKRHPAVVKTPPGDLSKGLLGRSLAVRVRLYRSELNPKGARYTPLAQVELSRGGRQ
jgi:2'-5' RNA ligase